MIFDEVRAVQDHQVLVFSNHQIEQAARAQSRPFRDELAELSDKGDAKQSHLTCGESPSFKEGVLQISVKNSRVTYTVSATKPRKTKRNVKRRRFA